MSRPTIGVLRPGSTFDAMIRRFGDYHAWFERALEPTGACCRVHDVLAEEPPDPASADGWLITGARSSVYDSDPWVGRLLDWVRRAHAEGAPLLGVCYGHQALCQALGGAVEPSPGGWEIGTVEVELTPAGRDDPLFTGFPSRFSVQTTHMDHVTRAPREGVVLAANEHTPVQAVAIGPTTRGVQFHPEVTTAISADFVAHRRHLLPGEPAVADAPEASRVLTNFVERFVTARRAAEA